MKLTTLMFALVSGLAFSAPAYAACDGLEGKELKKIHPGLATVLSKMGDPEGAFALTEPMITSGTDHADLAHVYAMLCRKLAVSRRF